MESSSALLSHLLSQVSKPIEPQPPSTIACLSYHYPKSILKSTPNEDDDDVSPEFEQKLDTILKSIYIEN